MLISSMQRKGAKQEQKCQKPLYISSINILGGMRVLPLCLSILFFFFLSFFLSPFLSYLLVFCLCKRICLFRGGKFQVFLCGKFILGDWGLVASKPWR